MQHGGWRTWYIPPGAALVDVVTLPSQHVAATVVLVHRVELQMQRLAAIQIYRPSKEGGGVNEDHLNAINRGSL